MKMRKCLKCIFVLQFSFLAHFNSFGELRTFTELLTTDTIEIKSTLFVHMVSFCILLNAVKYRLGISDKIFGSVQAKARWLPELDDSLFGSSIS